MKRILLASAAALALSGSAYAADLPVKAAPYQPAVPVGFNWSGIYVGIHGGWEWSAFDPGFSGSNSILTDLGNPGVLGANANGGFFGGHLGLNVQQGNWVFGPRFDIDLSGLQGSMTSPDGDVTHSIPWHGDVVGRLGYLVVPQVLLYGVGGLAFGEVKDAAAASSTFSETLGCSDIGAAPCALSNSNTHIGWTAGVGLEYAITSNFFLGLEWDYTNLGSHGVTFIVPGSTDTFNINDKAAWNSVKGMLTVKF